LTSIRREVTIRRFEEISRNHGTDGKIMHLRFLGTNSEQGTCPAVYATDRGTFAVQGKLIQDPEALADSINRSPDEVIVEIPKELVRFFEAE
jgi:hypothetical protein